ncbi:MAG: patatin-like phospholipase family protein [Candidatus Neomarinimicrobiota bacterium]
MMKPSIGIALGGGGVRGAAHIGVIQELENAKVSIDVVSGVSAGAVVGAMYAYSLDGRWVEEQFRKVMSSTKFDKATSKRYIKNVKSNSSFGKVKKILIDYALAILTLHKTSIIDNEELRNILELIIPARTFEQMQIPLKIVSTDIFSGNDIIDDSGDLIEALLQSCAIPGIMAPIEVGNKLIVDGGVSMPLPTPILKDQCDVILAVDIGVYDFEKIDRVNAKSIIMRSNIITSNKLKARLAEEADIVIRPETKGLHWSRFDSSEILFENGKNATKSSIPILNDLIKNKTRVKKTKNG